MTLSEVKIVLPLLLSQLESFRPPSPRDRRCLRAKLQRISLPPGKGGSVEGVLGGPFAGFGILLFRKEAENISARIFALAPRVQSPHPALRYALLHDYDDERIVEETFASAHRVCGEDDSVTGIAATALSRMGCFGRRRICELCGISMSRSAIAERMYDDNPAVQEVLDDFCGKNKERRKA